MKSLKKLFAASLLFLAGSTIAQNIETRELTPFNKIIIRDNAKVILHSGAQKITVDSKNNEEVKTLSENGTLSISGAKSELEISVPELTSIEISGNGSVIADSIIKTQTLRLSISGNGKISIPLEVSKLQTSISGMGKLELKGSADDLDLNISGNGKLSGNNLVVKKCDANISGVGKCFLDVRDALKLTINGTGSFYYKDKPAVFETHISGIGKYGAYANAVSNDSTTVTIGKSKIIIVGDKDDDDDDSYSWAGSDDSDSTKVKQPKKAKSHWAGVELGFNTLFTGSDFSSNLSSGDRDLELNSGKSINVNINLFYHDFKLYKNYIMFTTGIGLTLNNYRFNSDKTLRADTNKVFSYYDYDKNGNQISYTKNKLAVNYLTVPLLLQFNTNEELKKSFHIATGILISYKYNSHLKLVYKENGDKEKTKRQDEFNIEPFRYDATLRLGYRNYTVYASYALSDLFKSGRGAPELHPFQFGINVMGW